jgi:hypothetical protein
LKNNQGGRKWASNAATALGQAEGILEQNHSVLATKIVTLRRPAHLWLIIFEYPEESPDRNSSRRTALQILIGGVFAHVRRARRKCRSRLQAAAGTPDATRMSHRRGVFLTCRDDQSGQMRRARRECQRHAIGRGIASAPDV